MARAGGQDVEQPSEAKKQIPADAGLVIQSSDKDMGTVNVPASR
jgi:hypothetical protein